MSFGDGSGMNSPPDTRVDRPPQHPVHALSTPGQLHPNGACEIPVRALIQRQQWAYWCANATMLFTWMLMPGSEPTKPASPKANTPPSDPTIQ